MAVNYPVPIVNVMASIVLPTTSLEAIMEAHHETIFKCLNLLKAKQY